MSVTVTGNTANNTLSALTGDGTSYKLEGKGGDDVLKGSTGNDILMGQQGDDLLFGGLGSDTFVFDKFANKGDLDVILDFDIAKDHFSLGRGVKISNVEALHFDAATFSESSKEHTDWTNTRLANDSKVKDAVITLDITDGDKHFTQTVVVLDVIKNSTWSLQAFYDAIGYDPANVSA